MELTRQMLLQCNVDLTCSYMLVKLLGSCGLLHTTTLSSASHWIGCTYIILSCAVVHWKHVYISSHIHPVTHNGSNDCLSTDLGALISDRLMKAKSPPWHWQALCFLAVQAHVYRRYILEAWFLMEGKRKEKAEHSGWILSKYILSIIPDITYSTFKVALYFCVKSVNPMV